MAQIGNAFRGSKDYREFKIDQKVLHKLKNDCGYQVKNEYYFLLSNPEHIHLVLLLALHKKDEKTKKNKLANKLRSFSDGERETFNDYFINNQKRRQLIVPDAFEGLLKPLNYHQQLINIHHKQINIGLIGGMLENEAKGKLKIRQYNTLKNYFDGLNSKICQKQDIFLMPLEGNQLLLICFSEKPRNEQNVKNESSIILSHQSEFIEESEIQQKKEIKEVKVNKLQKSASPGKLKEQGESDEVEQIEQLKEKSDTSDKIFTVILLIALLLLVLLSNSSTSWIIQDHLPDIKIFSYLQP